MVNEKQAKNFSLAPSVLLSHIDDSLIQPLFSFPSISRLVKIQMKLIRNSSSWKIIRFNSMPEQHVWFIIKVIAASGNLELTSVNEDANVYF